MVFVCFIHGQNNAEKKQYENNMSPVDKQTMDPGCLPFSARDPRAFPLSGASKEHEQLHRKLHDDAAGKRISWWLRQRDKSNVPGLQDDPVGLRHRRL